MIKLVGLLICLLLFVASQAHAQVISEGASWKQNGASYLKYNGATLTFSASEIELHKGRLRCVKMNNYGCVMGENWQGSVGNDRAGHAVFEHPKWSVRAVVRDYCSKDRRGLKTALQIAEAYSPWCDTLGTVGVRNGWGRSCNGGPKPPADFSGPLCKKPTSGAPSQAQCGSCNCPDGVARSMSASVGLELNEDLGLFGVNGVPNIDKLTEVLRAKFRRETGFTVSDKLLKQGIELAGQCN